MSAKLDIFELKMDFFDNSELEELLLFIGKFQMTLEASGTLADVAQFSIFVR